MLIIFAEAILRYALTCASPILLRHNNRLFGGGGCQLRLSDHVLRIVRSPPCMLKCLDDSDERDECKNNSGAGRKEHQLGPPRHALLGLKVSLVSALLGVFGYLIFFGYQLADRGLDAVECGRKVYGVGLITVATAISVGSAFLLPWLVFGLNLPPYLPILSR
ncbi:hypothetical protein LCL97_08995 [Seohaeicola saemankumensis]|nr:hypothetical protein [Seohaeicola saemankumensis]MCA0870960.1 hypothetical protein [Seohaeicola saemankumensis]